MGDFGQLLKTYRLQCRELLQNRHLLTQEYLAERLSYESGVAGYSGSTISNWERGLNQIRRDDRHVLVGLVKVLYEAGGIKTLQEANGLLLAGNYRPLDDDEVDQVNPHWKQANLNRPDRTDFPSSVEQEAALPSPTYTELFGIEEVREQLLAQVITPTHPYILTVVALGGMGKTSLVDSIARHVIEQEEFDHVIWFSAENFEETAPEYYASGYFYQAVVNALYRTILPEGAPDMSYTGKLAYVRSKLKRHRYLVIIDNLEDPVEMNHLLNQLNALAGPSKFLLTARQHPSPGTESYVLTLQELDLPAAIAFLRHHTQTSGISGLRQIQEDEFDKIFRIVGGHPLALRLIPRLTRYYPLPEVLARWQEEQMGYIAEVYQSIYATLWQALSPSEKQLLQIMPLVAQVGGNGHQLQIVSGLSREAFWSSLTKLVELCLLETRVMGPERRYGIHSLTARFLEYRQKKDGGTAVLSVPPHYIQANIAHWRQTMSHLTEKQWQTLDIERANILRAIQVSLRLPDKEITQTLREDWVTLSESLWRYVERQGYVYEWLPILENLCQRFEGDSHVYCLLLNRLGELYRLNRQIDKAVDLHDAALRIAQESGNLLEGSRSHFNLGTDYFLRKKYDMAGKYGKIALGMFTEQGLAGREKAATLNLLGTVAQEQGELAQSVSYLEQAANIWRTIDQRPELARTLNNLARTHQRQHKIEEAQQCYAEARHILSQTGSTLDRILISLSEGEMHFVLKQFDKAETIFNSIDLQFLRQSGHLFYLACTLNNLGNVAFMRGNYDTADSYLQDSILLWRQLGDDLELANTLGRWGDILVVQNKPEAALAIYLEAEAIALKYPNERRANILREEVEQEMEKLRNKKGE
ncbi:MAG: tetratricopeptide repeat protein [Anaerolineae bacterium]|nr:tetratricopeptide repeat protein [Anaerolineae bacterium]